MCFAIPGRIVAVTGPSSAPVATVDFAGEQRAVDLAFLPHLAVGDMVIANGGFAISQVTEDQASEVLATIAEAAAALELASSQTSRQAAGQVCQDEVCITCSDEGRTAVVLQAPAEPWDLATVSTEQGIEEVDVTVVGPVSAGDRVLIHAGAAITRLEPNQ